MKPPAPHVAAVFLCLIAGCVAGCVDQAKEIAQYRKVLDDHRPKAAPLGRDETLTLAHALALANADNEQLASQGENYLQTLIDKQRAFAAFLPTLSFQPNFTAEQAPQGTAAPAVPGAPATSAAAAAASEGGYVQSGSVLHRFEAPVEADASFSFRDVPLYKAAKLAVAQQRQLLLDYQTTVMLDVARTYYQVVTAGRRIGVLRHSVALQEERVKNLEARLRMNLSRDLDVAQAEANESATRVQLRQAENDERNGRRMLALLIGVPEVSGRLTSDIAAIADLDPPKAYVDRALATRQDLLAANLAVQEARQSVKAAIAEYYPSVSLSLAGYLYRENYADASKWNGILLANLPIFSGGRIKADVRTAWSRFRQAALNASYLRREIEQGVLTSYDNLETSGVVLAELRREVAAAQEALQQSVAMEKHGLAIPLDVLAAQDTLLSAQLQYADETFNQTVSYLELIRSEGNLLPDTPLHLRWRSDPLSDPNGPI